MPPEEESVPQVVVQAEVHIAEISGEMLGYPASRPETEIPTETEVASAQTVPPSIAASACGSVRPSAVTGITETTSGFPLPARPETVTEGLTTHDVDPNTHLPPVAHTNFFTSQAQTP